jgi:hypothetical protein
MNEPHAPYAARVAAAEALLDRGWGKPKQSHEAEKRWSRQGTSSKGRARAAAQVPGVRPAGRTARDLKQLTASQ